jgi:hypothetical protein
VMICTKQWMKMGKVALVLLYDQLIFEFQNEIIWKKDKNVNEHLYSNISTGR